jgi:hypothetical protein
MSAINTQTSVSTDRRSFFAWVLFCIIAGGVFLAYTLTSLAAGRGEYVLPLDDVYIHFQYAHQLASGQPYRYNPGLPPTSGATSLLYPFVLAIGDLLGFRELNLGVWALGVGGCALLGSLWLIYQIGRRAAPHWLAVVIAVAFGITGAFGWHYMSGMETGLAALAVLLTLYGMITGCLRITTTGATLLALIRPELGALAVLTVAALILPSILNRLRPRSAPDSGAVLPRWWQPALLLPLLALTVQPLVNWAITGSAVASGSRAKSILNSVPFYPDAVAERIFDQFARMWREFATGSSPREGVYVPLVIVVLAGIGLLVMLARRGDRRTGLLVLAWLGALTLAVSTLDTAFWHFKRYQIPALALFFPLAAWGAGWLWIQMQSAPGKIIVSLSAPILSILILVSAAETSAQFVRYYAVNSNSVYSQPLQMARWLRYNTPADATVAVHDTGLLRYISQRTSIDMVGLTTPDAADYWRNGPGAVGEYLLRTRPDYIASYGTGHGFGLGFLVDTSLYGRLLAGFPVVLDDRVNVALAADYQGIYQPDWAAPDRQSRVMQPSSLYYTGTPAAALNVADIEAEQGAVYAWRNEGQTGGFPSDIYEIDYADCAVSPCRVTDGGRRINREEAFTFHLPPAMGGQPMVLITRVHPVNPGTFDVYVNDSLVATRWLPMLPGAWLEIPTLIPTELAVTPLHIRIVPQTGDGHYLPYFHWLYTADYPIEMPADEPFATFQEGALRLYHPVLTRDSGRLRIDLTWGSSGQVRGDYKLFVHILPLDSDQPVAQYDNRPLNGSLPPGNWLPGVIPDSFVVDLTTIPAGQYRVMMGFYDPITFERLQPTDGDEAGRLFLGEVEIGHG